MVTAFLMYHALHKQALFLNVEKIHIKQILCSFIWPNKTSEISNKVF